MVVFGLNQNIEYKGRVYHVQTEDSGRGNPHIITHLFTDGIILDSKKTEYDDILEIDDLEKILKELMQQQHRGVAEALKNGEYDDVLPEAPAGAEAVDAPQEQAPPPGAPPPLPPDATAPPDEAPAPQQPPPDVAAPAAAPPSQPTIPAASRSSTGARPRPAPRPRVAPGGGTARRRFAQEPRQPSVFGKAEPQQQDTIFGEDLISERSLDEVILGYLADDMSED